MFLQHLHLAPATPPPAAADDVEEEVDPASFSAGIVPGEEWREALVGKINQHINSEFVQADKDRNMQRRLHKLPGENMLFKYACSDDSLLGQGCQRIGVECTRLTKQVVDLSDPEQVNQVLGQVQAMPGADVWLSITCTFHSPLQNLNIHQYGRLTTRVTRWSRFEDRQLRRCICYLHHSREKVLTGWINHKNEDEASIDVYTDSDFAACPYSAKSTSGILIIIRTEGAVFPLYWTSRKQSSTARSTPEAEMIAMSTAMFSEAFSVQTMLEHLLQRSVRVTYKQDNLGVVQISHLDIL